MLLKFRYWCALLIFAGSVVSSFDPHTISDCPAGSNCVKVPNCAKGFAYLNISMLSSGVTTSRSSSTISLCYDSVSLKIVHIANMQEFFPVSNYEECNDNIFYLDVVEAFIAPYVESEPHCYTELDLAPKNQFYASGIFNPNLNHTGVTNSLLNCSMTGIIHQTEIEFLSQKWTATMSVPWTVLDCPHGCPLDSYCSTKANRVYRANFFRVNELVATTKCTSTECEYMAWNPTLANPPAFHEPLYFNFLVLE